MTSYATANESSSSSTSNAATTNTTTTTNTTAVTTVSQIGNTTNDDTIKKVIKQNCDNTMHQQQQQRPAQLQQHLQQQQHMQHQHDQQQQNQQDLSDYEEREEKADTTPENYKKIDDDIIELELERERERIKQQKQQLLQQQQQQLKEHNSAMNDVTLLNSTSNEALALGLAVAIDESNAKFCFVRKPTTPTPQTQTQTPSPIATITTSTSLCNEKEAESRFFKTGELMTSTPSTSSSAVASPTKLLQSPENYNNINNDSSTASNITTTTTTAQDSDTNIDNASKRSACAFTLSFDNDDSNAAATQAARYKSVMERFQNRHRRGASMSKLDNGDLVAAAANDGSTTMSNSLTGDTLILNSSASATASPLTLRNNSNATNKKQDDLTSISKVKLRPRDRSTSRVRDAAKRHSWSPRSSTNELTVAPPLQQQQQQRSADAARPPMAGSRRSNTTATTTTMTTATVKTKPPPPPPLVMPKGNSNLVANRTQFTPRSTAMQLALQKIDMLLPQAPLGDFVRNNGGVAGGNDDDDISEAGTYTLDGDNYTEEQKDLMNIDKSLRQAARRQHKHERHEQLSRKEHAPLSPRSPTSPLKPDLGGATKIPIRTSNVLEVNYFHNEDEDETQRDDNFYNNSARLKAANVSQSAAADLILGNSQTAGALLGKIRSRVLRNLLTNQPAAINQTTTQATSTPQLPPTANSNQQQQQKHEDDADVGCFTSVTTSGVLAKQSTLDPRPKLNRKNSLTTSQIDSSEYISNEVKLKNAPTANVGGGYTDHQKAEYRLNLFTNQKDLQKYAATRNLIETPPETPIATTDKLPSDTVALTMAQTKNDWIQQWARNARARSEAACIGKHQHQQQQQQQLKNNIMTRSYNCGSTTQAATDTASLTDDSLYNSQLLLNQRYREREDFDYSSDPTLMSSNVVKPPKSPSKIPSPLHSLGRARSASRTRGSLQGLLNAQDDELCDNIYLQKTAAAINNLQQSISRKNSLKSPTNGDSLSSPRRRTIDNAVNSADDSPLHSIESDGYRNTRHRRNLSNEGYVTAAAAAAAAQAQLMTSSFNEQQLQLLTSGEYLMKQMRMRKNSFDGNICSPRRRVERVPEQQHQQQQQKATISPLHRAGSFSMKGNATQHQRAARPQFQNIYTPPAARQGGYVPLHHQQQQHQQQLATQVAIKKSASSNNFIQNSAYDDDYDENLAYYINDADDDDLCVDIGGGHGNANDCDDDEDDIYGNDDEIYGDYEAEYGDGGDYGPRTITLKVANLTDDAHAATHATTPLTTTRYNKALLMRIERSKQRVAATNNKPVSAPAATKSAAAAASAALANSVAGLVACPNTPELPRRNVKSAPRAGLNAGTARQSVPRDASLSRLASQVPNSLASAKRQLLQTAAAGMPMNARNTAGTIGSNQQQRVQPKYLDISKYKPAQGNAFLRKNESKSTLKTPTLDSSGGIKRSPSSSGLSRNDPTRASNRSIRSIMTSSCTGAIGGGGGGGVNSSGASGGNVSRASSTVRRDDSVSKQKEIEMAMWKRRSTYDPLKAAAEDRRRREEAKRLAISKNANEVLCESTSTESQQ